jgi:opacity protein-like surface antigen
MNRALKTHQIIVALAAALLAMALMVAGASASDGQTNVQEAENKASSTNISTAISGDAKAGILSRAESGDAKATSSSQQKQSNKQAQLGVNVGGRSQSNEQEAENKADTFNDSLAASGDAKAGILSSSKSGDAKATSKSSQRQENRQKQIGVNVR